MTTVLRPAIRPAPAPASADHDLRDVWHGEQLLAWKLDAWLLEYGAGYADAHLALAHGLRKSLRRGRESLKREVQRSGLQLIRLPIVAPVAHDATAAQQLRGIYAQLTRQHVRVRRLLSGARRGRDFSSAIVLREVQDAHAEALRLFESLLLRRGERALEFAA